MRAGVSMLAACLALSLAACAGTRHAPPVDNPYADSAAAYASEGVAAMQRGRWDVAERSFARQLAASQMADDVQGIMLAHYNIAMARLGDGRRQAGDDALWRVLALARRHHAPVMAARARLALALDQARHGGVADVIRVEAAWPPDLQLSAGRLALYRHDITAARRDYARVLRRAGTGRAGVVLQAEAHLGLAMAARAEHDDGSAAAELRQVQRLCRRAGAPRVAADALVMQASMGAGDGRDGLERALAIYRQLQDRSGERRALAALVAASSGEARARWQGELHNLEVH